MRVSFSEAFGRVHVTTQYRLRKIIGIWLLVTLPMLLPWTITPAAVERNSYTLSILRICMIFGGLVWQFVLTLIIVRRERGSLSLRTLRSRLRLTLPINPRTGRPDRSMFLWLIPICTLHVAFIFFGAPILDDLQQRLLPALAEPPAYGMEVLFTVKDRFVGQWWFFVLFMTLSVFNVFLGEELLFHGLLFPAMNEVFRRWDWLAIAMLFALYHVHQPWGYTSIIVSNAFFLALPLKLFKSTWMSIASHAVQFPITLVVMTMLTLGTL